MKNDGAASRCLWLIFITIFLDMLGIGILVPVFPALINHDSPFRVTPLAWSQSQSLICAGWLLAVYPLSQFLATPILGQLSDRYGRRRILIIAILGTAGSYLLFAIGILQHSLGLLFIARAIDGLSGGNISIAQAVIADVSTPQKRARNFGLTGVAIGVGFVCGPFIGGKLADPAVVSWFTPATPFWLACGLGLTNSLIIALSLPETLSQASQQAINWQQSIANLSRGFSDLKLRRLIPILFLYNFGFTLFTTFWGIILNLKFGYTQGQIGNFFAVLGVMIILAQGGVVRRLSGRIAEVSAVKWGLSLSCLSLLLYAFIPVHLSFALYWVLPLLAVATAITKAFSSALLTTLSTKDELGKFMGVNASCNALAQALPAILAGYLASGYYQAPVLGGALVLLIAAYLFRCRWPR